MPRKYTSEERIVLFWSRVAITADDEQCWLWQAGCDQDGYGMFRLDGSNKKSHRISWTLTNGTIPRGLFVLHKCDNPACVNPKHLFLGTHQDNMDDMVSKQRGVHPNNEQHGMCRLTDEQILTIRRRYAEGGIYQRELAAEYGVSEGHIYRIVNRIRRK